MPRTINCSLCGYTFEPDSLACHSECPLSQGCAIICCPNCGYQAVDTSKSTTIELIGRVRRWLVEAHGGLSRRIH